MIIRQESAREVDDTCFCNEIYDDLEDRFRSKFAAFAARHSAEMDFKQFYRYVETKVLKIKEIIGRKNIKDDYLIVIM